MALYAKSGYMSRAIVTTTAQVLINRCEDQSLKNIVVTDTWAKSFWQRSSFRRRAGTTAKVEIPESAKKEAGVQHHYRVANIAEKHHISPALILNSDQTPSKCVQVGRLSMAPDGSKQVWIAGGNDKHTITWALTVICDGDILLFQIIYKGKTKAFISQNPIS